MKILFLTSGANVPSTRFRVLPFLSRLTSAGHTCVVAHSRPDKYEHSPWLGFRLSQRCRKWKRRLDVLRARWGRFDVVFLERELFHDATFDMEERFRRVARRLVLDVDDGIFLTWPEKFARVAAFVDVVIAGSDLLAAECRRHNPNVVVIPTCVDLNRYRVKPHVDRSVPVLGWTGTSSNLRYLQSLAGPLGELRRRRPFSLGIIADAAAADRLPQVPDTKVKHILWTPESETEGLLGFDVGLMPLPDEPWAAFKCGLKLIQYMAVGLPTVASPVGVNPQIVADGESGFLAAGPEEWVERLDRLLGDDSLRSRMGRAGRAIVERRYSVDALWVDWLRVVLGR